MRIGQTLTRTRVETWRKLVPRVARVIASAAERLAAPLGGALISLAAIRRASVETWGGLVEIMVVVQLAAHLVGWGNREILIREFSRSPARIATTWKSSLITRLSLVAPIGVAAALAPWPGRLTLFGALWCLGLIGVQSMESLIVYRLDFLHAALVEVAGSLLVLALVWNAASPPTAMDLATWFALASWLKLAALLLRHRRSTFDGGAGRFDPTYFRRALPFFLLGLTGLLQSRADLYAATWLLPAETLGSYQVLLTMLVLLQSGSAFLLAPVTRALYRLRHHSILRLSRRLLTVGLFVVATGLVGIHFALDHLYRNPLSLCLLLLGGAMILPSYYYLPSIYELFRNSRQTAVVRINLAAAAWSFVLSLLLLPVLGLAGALLAAATAQWGMLVAYVSLAGSVSRHAPVVPSLR